jgi:hypothetical protein
MAPAGLRPDANNSRGRPLKVALDLLKILAEEEEGRFSWLAVVLPHSAPMKKSLSAASRSVFPSRQIFRRATSRA